jgi:hypothetical protein
MRMLFSFVGGNGRLEPLAPVARAARPESAVALLAQNLLSGLYLTSQQIAGGKGYTQERAI